MLVVSRFKRTSSLYMITATIRRQSVIKTSPLSLEKKAATDNKQHLSAVVFFCQTT